MKTLNILAAAALLAAPLAHAGTLSGASSALNGVSTTTSPPKITTPGQILQIKHLMGVACYGPDKNPNFACNAKLNTATASRRKWCPSSTPWRPWSACASTPSPAGTPCR